MYNNGIVNERSRKMNIGEKIQICRKNKKMSQEELGERLMVSRQTISLWETGQTIPSIDNLVRLKEIFDMSLDSILCDEQEIKINPDEEISSEFTEADNSRLLEAISKRHNRKFINFFIILTAALVLALLAGAEGVGHGFMICLELIYVGILIKSKHSLTATKKLYPAGKVLTLRYELYGDHLVFHKLCNGEWLQSTKIPYTEIEKMHDMGEFWAIQFRNQLYSIKASCIDENSRLRRLKKPETIYSPQSIEASRRTSISLALIVASFGSILAALAIMDRVVVNIDRFIESTWIFFLFIPIPLALMIYGIVLQAQKKKGVMNIVLGALVLAVLCLYGSFCFFL